MQIPLDAPEVLEREFPQIRAKLIQLAASLDRLDRAAGDVAGDSRLEQISQALGVLAGSQADRAEQLQMIFSLPYREDWRQEFFG